MHTHRAQRNAPRGRGGGEESLAHIIETTCALPTSPIRMANTRMCTSSTRLSSSLMGPSSSEPAGDATRDGSADVTLSVTVVLESPGACELGFDSNSGAGFSAMASSTRIGASLGLFDADDGADTT